MAYGFIVHRTQKIQQIDEYARKPSGKVKEYNQEEIEAFIQTQTFTCPTMRARLTPAACENNQRTAHAAAQHILGYTANDLRYMVPVFSKRALNRLMCCSKCDRCHNHTLRHAADMLEQRTIDCLERFAKIWTPATPVEIRERKQAGHKRQTAKRRKQRECMRKKAMEEQSRQSRSANTQMGLNQGQSLATTAP